ncbi:uncharacterized protein LOC124301128 isoform X3 [Neodiprion virginianus]|uniref:uncharacterized protein LOC124301128 isoform X3 n=1 Tax=Neodiprion virginianus TaxID=2961670 RepID=UPI001EE71C17|nr:uncharacterized protein LOC124301128 isoform X3 [Neodiprion virginianus]
MADKKDDPREVLSLLNSLGFVGITAQQLKAFMKDLKMHRKIRERERQQWKEDTKKKILLRQQQLYREVLHEHKTETGGLNSRTENKEDEIAKENHHNYVIPAKKTGSAKTHTSWAEEFRQNSLNSDNGYNTSSSSLINESHRHFDRLNNISQNHSAGASTDSTKYISLEKSRSRATRSEQNLKQTNLAPSKSSIGQKASSSRSAPVISENCKRSQTTEVHANPPPSRSSIQSRPKSCEERIISPRSKIIRPWRLQPESHRSCTNTKSDPVALYQKYKEEWKQLALPGEENHAGVRWAVREKMLGLDPNPRPILKKSCSTSAIKKR